MKIKEQVVSLELAKELKKLGVKQDSLWYHAKFEDDSYLDVVGATQLDSIFQLIQRGFFEFEQFDEIYSAYTVAELGEKLSRSIVKNNHIYYLRILYRQYEDDWLIIYEMNSGINCGYCSDTMEANARAKILIYCINNHLFEL